jgi:hypothetical protein
MHVEIEKLPAPDGVIHRKVCSLASETEAFILNDNDLVTRMITKPVNPNDPKEYKYRGQLLNQETNILEPLDEPEAELLFYSLLSKSSRIPANSETTTNDRDQN